MSFQSLKELFYKNKCSTGICLQVTLADWVVELSHQHNHLHQHLLLHSGELSRPANLATVVSTQEPVLEGAPRDVALLSSPNLGPPLLLHQIHSSLKVFRGVSGPKKQRF